MGSTGTLVTHADRSVTFNCRTSWQPMNSGLANTAVRDLVVLPGDGQTVIAGLAAGGGVFRSSDAGACWAAINDGLP